MCDRVALVSVPQLREVPAFGPRPIGLEELFAFWRSAVAHGFADRMARPVCPQRRGFPYAFRYTGDRNLEYCEEFAGALRWSGDELIVHDFDRPMWRLSLHGACEPWLIDEETRDPILVQEAPARLREALNECRREPDGFAPRGPLIHRMDMWLYRCRWEGSFEEFHGSETLSHNGTTVLRAHFHGGLIL